MKYKKPNKPHTFYLDNDHRVESDEYAWIFSRKSENEDRFRFLFNSPKLINLLILIKEYCMRRSNKNHLHEVLEEAEILMEEFIRSHDAFMREYLHSEKEYSDG